MLFYNFYHKPAMLGFVLILLSGFFHSSFSQTTNHDAANWNTWYVTNPSQVKITSYPSTTESKSELKLVKQRMQKVDEKKLKDIKYWNAGAPALRWNQISPTLISWEKFEHIARGPSAWMNVAIYDATVLAWKEKVKHKRKRPSQADPSIKPLVNNPSTFSYPCEHSVTAAAAATVLAYFFPEKADSILQLAKTASQSRIDAGVQYPSDVEAGWKMGEEVAKQIIELAKKDGSTAQWDGKKNTDPGKWTGAFPLGITLAKFTPMIIQSPAQFRPPAPPDFANDMKELKAFKNNYRSNSQAYYWANTGMEMWNDLTNKKLFEYRMADDAPVVARIFSVLHVGMHDAAIAIMDAKYAYWGIRPDQYDTTYKPLIHTPPFPGYPSGHAAGSSVSATIMEYFFPADAKQFQKLAKDCAESRFFAGIHFRTDNEVGIEMGKELGKYIVESLMKK